MRLFSVFVLMFLLLIGNASFPASADDWPKWMGPLGTNVWPETGIVERFPQGGPKQVWETRIGGGFSGPAVAKGRVFVTDFQTEANVKISNFERREFDGMERVLCLNESDGKLIWKHEYKVRYTISYPAGPRCTPVIDDGLVYTLGAEGHLFCFNESDGKIVWSRELKKDYQTKSPLWGYAGHPLIDGDHLITLAGGNGSHLVALNKKTGKEIWRTLTSPEQGYAPPRIIEAGGVRQLITLRPDGVSSVDPATGKEHWTVDYKADSGSIIMTPIHYKSYLYVAGYSRKSLLMELDSDRPAAKAVWRNRAREVMSPVNVQPYLDEKEGVIYGADQNGELRASRLPQGTLLWSTIQPISDRRVGNGTVFIVKQADRFWLFNDSGYLVIAKMTPAGYEEIDRAKVIEPTNVSSNRPVVWSMPAFANRRVYIRNDEKIVCLDLAQTPASEADKKSNGKDR